MTWMAVITGVYLIFNGVGTIAVIGRPRKPIDPLTGVFMLPLLALGILWIVAWQQRWTW